VTVRPTSGDVCVMLQRCGVPVRLRVAFAAILMAWGCSNPTPAQQQTPAAARLPVPVRYDGPPLPFEDAGACPFEGCTYRDWTATAPVTVRQARQDDAPVAFTLPAGARVTALTGVVVTVVPGIVELREPMEVQTGQGPVAMNAGEVFYLLTYQGEGFGKIWIKGGVRTDVDLSRFKPKRGPTAVWWIQVRNARGQVGWTRQADAFDGKDRLS
jgi:hypothetical protein